MNKKRCIVIWDFVGTAGIVVKRGTISEVLDVEKDYVWINPYIEEIGEEIPFPIFKNYIQYL